MGPHAVDTVTAEDKQIMKEILSEMDEVSVDEIANREDTPFESKQEVVSVLHALLNEGDVSHTVNREYFLTT